MKRIFTVTTIITLLLLLAAACDQGLKSIEAADPGDFPVDLRRISLNATELATVPGRNPVLSVIKTPVFTNRAELKWTSYDEDVATVDPSSGALSVRTDPVTEPMTTIIRVESVNDPSIYATCSLTVYPEYPTRRRWNFATQDQGFGTTSSTNYDGVDKDFLYGMIILRQTGGATHNDVPNVPGRYEIDPENPYELGVEPNGTPRSGMQWRNENLNLGSGTAFYRAPADYFTMPSTAADNSTRSDGHLRTGGTARFMKIAVLQGPFTVIVNYMSNGTAGARADIRVGDKESGIIRNDLDTGEPIAVPALRIQGEGSPGTTSGDERSVWYTHKETELVPMIYIETSTGLRIYDVYVLDYALYQYIPVPNTFNITGDASITVGDMVSYTTNLASNLTESAYKWEITSGGNCVEIVGLDNRPTVNLKGVAEGTVTLQATVTTVNPNLEEDDPDKSKTVSITKDINIIGYSAIQSVTIGGPDTVDIDKTITLSSTLNPANATAPAYRWEITGGGDKAEIDGNANEASVKIKGKTAGTATVTLTVTTRNPANPSAPDTRSITKDITVKYEPVTGVTITSPSDKVGIGGNLKLTAAPTPAEPTKPTYLWEITSGGTFVENPTNTTDKDFTVKGKTPGSVTVQVTVTSNDPGNPANTHSVTNTKIITVEDTVPMVTVTKTWLFNATTAAAAGLTLATYYDITADTDFKDGLTLKVGSSTTAHAIRQSQASGGITGCLQLGGNNFNWGEITGISGEFTLELKYSDTGGTNGGRYPTVQVGTGTVVNFTTQTGLNTNLLTDSITATGDGSVIKLGASAGLRIYQVKITYKEPAGGGSGGPKGPQIWRTNIGAASGTIALSGDKQVLTMTGTGSINTSGQIFNFVYLPVSDDFTMTVKINSVDWVSTASNASRAGIIGISQTGIIKGTDGTLTSDSTTITGASLAYGATAVRGPTSALAWGRFHTASTSWSAFANISGAAAPTTPADLSSGGGAYLKLRRAGSTWTAHYSLDGTTWSTGSSPAPASGNFDCYLGLYVGANTGTGTVVFSDLRLVTGKGDATNAEIAAVDPIDFSWLEQ